MQSLLWLLLIGSVVSLTIQRDPVDNRILLPIGLLAPFGGPYPDGQLTAPMTELAFSDVNNNASFLPGYKLVLYQNDSQCTANFAVASTLWLVENVEGLVAIIGDECSGSSKACSFILQIESLKIPLMSITATSPELSDKFNHPTFCRVCPTDSFQSRAWVAVAKKFGWTHVTVLYSDSELNSLLAETFIQIAPDHNITVVISEKFPDTVGADMTVQLDAIAKTRVNVVFLAVSPQDLKSVLRIGNDLGIVGPGRVWVGTDGSATPGDLTIFDSLDPIYTTYPVYAANLAARDNYLTWGAGYICTNFAVSTSNFWSQTRARYEQTFNISAGSYPSYVDFGYDVGLLLAYGLRSVLIDQGMAYADPLPDLRTALWNAFTQVRFEGITPGTVALDSNGDRPGQYALENFILAPSGDVMTKVVTAIWDPVTDTWTESVTVIWSDNTTDVPIDRPPIEIYTINPATKIVFIVLACIAIGINLIYFIALILNYNHSRIRAATPFFLVLIIFSSCLALSIVIVIAVTPTDATCIIPHWFGHVAFTLTFSCLFFKTFRVWLIFSKASDLQTPVVITNGQLMLAVILPVLGMLVYLSCFTAINPPHPVYIQNPSDPLQIILKCEFDTDWVIGFYAAEAAGLICCLYLVWRTRKIELLRFNESSHIAICIYCLLIIGLVLIPNVHWLSGNTVDGSFVLESVCIIIASLTVSSAILLPKYKAIYRRKLDSDQTTSSGSADYGSKKSVSRKGGSKISVGTPEVSIGYKPQKPNDTSSVN